MTNQAEIDYEKQFQDDLAKATALSLEQEALDEYRRSKKYGATRSIYERSPSIASTGTSSQDAAAAYYAQLRRRHLAQTDENNARTTPSPSQPPQRRFSEASSAAAVAVTTPRSQTPPPPASTQLESDLISFASPTSREAASASSFDKLIEDLQLLQSTNPQSALVPLGPTAAAPLHTRYRPAVAPTSAAFAPPQFVPGAPTLSAAAGGLQLVPFQPTQPQQKAPLTNEELQKLYNMPPASAYAQGQIGFMAPPSVAGGFYPPQYAPSAVVSAGAYPQPPPGAQFAHAAYGFQYNVMPHSAATASPAAPPGTFYPAAAVPGGSVANPGSALVPLAVAVATNGSSSAGGGSTPTAAPRRQTPPVRKSRSGEDLIDLNQEDDSRVSVLEAFDPLLNESDGVWKK